MRGIPCLMSDMAQNGEVSTCIVVHGVIGNGTATPLRMSRGRFDLPALSTVGTSTCAPAASARRTRS